jgi:hypothetical protein
MYYCDNHIIFQHRSSKMIYRLKMSLHKKNLCQEFIPVPADIKQEHVVEFCVNEWGTEQDIESVSIISENKNNIEVCFQTINDPPIEALYAMIDMGFNIQAYYCDFKSYIAGYLDNTAEKFFVFEGIPSNKIQNAIGENLDNVFKISKFISNLEKDKLIFWYERGVEELKLENK